MQSVTDYDGRFSITLNGKTTLIFRSMGYVQQELEVDPASVRELVVMLQDDAQNLSEVTVSSASAQARVAEMQIGVQKIEIAEMAKLPVLFGERDIMKSIQLLPGVDSEGDGTSGYQVRGGTSSQNLILLDGATIFNAGHLMGIFSTFNDDALTNAALYKGQVPAQFGGGASSVFDISTKAGAMDKYRGSLSVGLLSAKGYVEGPIARSRASFFVSARRSYLDLFLKLTDSYSNDALNFYDVNAKLTFRAADNDIVAISFFRGRDNLGLEDLMDMGWGNTSASARWAHSFSEKSRSTLTATASKYLNDVSVEVLNTQRSMGGAIRQLGLKESVDIDLEKHKIDFGAQGTLTKLISAEWLMENYYEKEERAALELDVWASDDVQVTDKLGASIGLRTSYFAVLGGSPYYVLDENNDIAQTLDFGVGEVVKSYFTLEPRLAINLLFDANRSLKIGYSRNSQNIHALRNSSMSLPFDRYTMTSNIIRPQVANQLSAGYIHLTQDAKYELSTEAYFKKISNVYDYLDGKSFMSEVEVERIIERGRGRAYGLELYARKNVGRLTGWASYTLAWSENKIQGINNSRWYTSANDRRHNVTLVAICQLSPKWDISGTWTYSTGQALTAPSAKYDIGGETYYYYAERNGYRAPAYHRLDLSATNTKVKTRYTRQWSFGLYNAYNRYNPFIITFQNDTSRPSGTKTIQYSLFGILPSVTYTLKF